MLLPILVCLIIFLLLKKIIEPTFYWKKRNVKYLKPWPLLGNMEKVIMRKQSFLDNLKEMYNTYPNERYYGIYRFNHPMLLVKDLDLIKQITVKSFDHFPDHLSVTDENLDPLMAKMLISLKGDRWKEMRAFLSPAFTSSKMKVMFHLISDCAEQLTEHFLVRNKNLIELEMKDMFSKFTNDVIATTAFGIKCDSLKSPNNKFFEMGKEATNAKGMRLVKGLLFTIAPSLMKLLKIQVFPEASDFFLNLIKNTIKTREEKNIIRPDMIHLLMEAKKEMLKHEENKEQNENLAAVEDSQTGKSTKNRKAIITEMDIAAQALLFFFAGYETSSTLMSFVSHELAINKTVQEKLQEEIDLVYEKTSGKVTYEDIQKMKYLDMVILEGLRMWPPAVATDRICVKDFTVEPVRDGEEVLVIKKGENVLIPIIGIHYDPEYFQNPEKFDPERFSDENSSKIIPYSFLPFGSGPRNCIGSRFALLEIKTLFFNLLLKFDIIPIEKSTIPIRLTTKSFKLAPEEGFWLGLKKRQG